MQLIQINETELTLSHQKLGTLKKAGLGLVGLGTLFLLLALTGLATNSPVLFIVLSLGLMTGGAFISFYAQRKEEPPGIKNNQIWQKSFTARGSAAWILGVAVTGFYIVLYWFPDLLEHWIRMVDPVAYVLYNGPADQWFLYGFFYTVAILIMGSRMILVKYRHSNYQKIRTASIMFFQTGFAFLIPFVLKALNQPDFYFTYFWPLKYDYLFPGTVDYLLSHPGGLGVFMVFWGAVMTFLATPVLTWFFGKRWYCSWVCGCGGLANTAGDPFRQLSDKSLTAWKTERRMIYSVLVFIIVTTALLWLNSIYSGSVLGSLSQGFKKTYGFAIGAMFSGVIGVGFYPIMGTRVWCRFGCPMAAYLGILQKFFSRFRITTNGGQCISCGNCSTYCEMGIDVRWYAQRGENIVRASCVGCGVCSAVCPRGVLNLENGPRENRFSILNAFYK